MDKYRIAKLEVDDIVNWYLCSDDSINVGDYVFVSDNNTPLKVIEIKIVKKTELEKPMEEMKSVIRKYIDVDSSLELAHNVSSEEENIKISCLIEKNFSYADYHTDCLMKVEDLSSYTNYSFIKSLAILNHTNNTYNNLKLYASFNNDIFSSFSINVRNVDSYEEVSLRIPFIKVNRDKLELVNEIEATSITFKLIDESNNEEIAVFEHYFNILPISQPSMNIISDSRLYAKYVTPLTSSVKQITLNALKENKNNPLIGYQNNDKYNDIISEGKAIYDAIHKWGISYQNPPAGGLFYKTNNLERISQRLRMSEEVLKDKKGTCLDLSLLYCSCLEEIGLNPLLIIIDNHAFAGFFLKDNLILNGGEETNLGKFSNLASRDMNNIILVECTCFTIESNVSFNDAISRANNELRMYEGKVFKAIDINTCHKGVFKSIPLNNEQAELELNNKPEKVVNDNLEDIIERKYVNVLRKQEKDRFTLWEKKLLDLTERNQLVNLKMKTSNCVKVISNSDIANRIKKNDSIKIQFINNVNTSQAEIENNLFKNNLNLRNTYNINDDNLYLFGLEKTLKNLIKVSNSAMDETGAPTLYLTLGMLTYTRKNKEKGHAPFMVLPIKVVKEKMNSTYTINYDYDNVMINQTFFEYYVNEHNGVDFSELYSVNSEDDFTNIVHTFKENCSEDIMLDETSFFIANLTFAHYIMWNDIRNRKEELKKNKVIQSIIENKNVLNQEKIDLSLNVESLEKYNNFAAPLYYDSTQLRAILECGEGKSFILNGPPGTGKSQTIVNMIINAFYMGKTVLFVAEKKAALDVVADRINKLQLGRFCLELHSNKASKAEFFQKLGESMNYGTTKNCEEFDNKCNELEEKKNKILTTINKMHEHKYYLSLYEAILNHERLDKTCVSSDFSKEYLESLNKEKVDEIYNLINEYIHRSSAIYNYEFSSLKAIKMDYINSISDKERFVNDFKDLKELFDDFIKAYKLLLNYIKINTKINFNHINSVMKLLDIIFKKEIYENSINEFINIDDNKVNELFEITNSILMFENNNKDIYKFAELEKCDTNSALNELNNAKNIFKKVFVNFKYKKLLKDYICNKSKIKKSLIKCFEEIENYNNLKNRLKNESMIIDNIINDSYYSNYHDFNMIIKKYYNTRDFVNSIKNISDSNELVNNLKFFLSAYKEKNSEFNLEYSFVLSKFNLFIDKEKKVKEIYNIDNSIISNMDDSFNKYIELLSLCSKEENFNDVVDIVGVNSISDKLCKLGLKELLYNVSCNKLDYRLLKDSFDLSCSNGYIKLYFDDDNINFFNPELFNSEINKYRELINEYNNLVIESVSYKLTKNLNHGVNNYALSSPIGMLKKSINNNGRGISIRDTISKYDDIIKKYFPCFLMSPLSAAQYLSVDEKKKAPEKFDLVIFDEASQIPVHEAIGPIARGKALIVAGDEEQMPPSAYFSAGIEVDEENLDYDDAKSLLDECLAIDLPKISLSYHYRSKHESLISFSNKMFYNSSLYTFPSPKAVDTMIEFNYIDLKENKKNSDISKEEVDAICNKFKEIYNDPNNANKSVGIIVFNIKQKDRVYDAITNLLAKDAKLNEIVENATKITKEPYFVKSLENVQGDERDIIILSIGFRKNSAFRAQVVGPIIRVNGQRRLNVAVSRSKEKMIVISTIKYSDFEDDTEIRNKGKLYLKKFLDYAENKTYVYNYKNYNSKEELTNCIKKELEKEGYDVVLNVGNSEFKVDLAIRNKNTNCYELGVLIDSKPIGNGISCRDKMFVQNMVLNNLKWKIVSIYSLEYYKDKKGTLEKIKKELGKEYIKYSPKINPHIEKGETQKIEYKDEEYKETIGLKRCNYSKSGYSKAIYDNLIKIVNEESPVSFNIIKERIKKCCSMKVMSETAKTRLKYAIRECLYDYSEDQTQKFYWKKDANKEVTSFRLSGNRDIYDISKEEIACAMKQIIDIQKELSDDDLFRLTLEAFKYKTTSLTYKNKERLLYVKNWMNSKNK